MENNNPNYKRAILASIIASVLMLTYGLSYRILRTQLVAPVNVIDISPEALQRFPLAFADWSGQDIPMDEAIARATNTDTYINRNYKRKNDLESVSLFLGCNVSAFEHTIHRPEICYTVNGWELINRRSAELSLDNGIKIPNSIFRFSRGDLKRQETLVLHYYVVDGQYYEEVFPLQAKLWRLSGTADYIGRVMISTTINFSDVEKAKKQINSFTVDSAPLIVNLFMDIHNNQIAYSSSKTDKGNSL